MTDREQELKEHSEIVKDIFKDEIARVVSRETSDVDPKQLDYATQNSQNNEAKCIVLFCEGFASVDKIGFKEAARKVKDKNIYPNVGF